MDAPLPKRVAVEALGTALFLATIVGSGVMAERVAGGNAALVLLASSLAVGAALAALVAAFGALSGAHLNPAVTLAQATIGGLPWREVPGYVGGQLLGAFAGVAAAHAAFGLPLLSLPQREPRPMPQLVGEALATVGFLAVHAVASRTRPESLPLAAGGFVAAAHWFAPSSGFANPAVTLARAVTDTFVGIRRNEVGGLVLAEVGGAIAAVLVLAWLVPAPRAAEAADPLAAPGPVPSGRAKKRRGGKVLFACVENAGRSQMAAAWFNELVDPTKARAVSAGTEPAEAIDPTVRAAMKEVGIDLDGAKPRLLTNELGTGATLVVTMGCAANVPGAPREEWRLDDPAGAPIERVREIRDELRDRVTDLLEARGWGVRER